jgi:CRISPR/Cas system-associated exonuclease Cas4 (RecB family)
MGSPPGGYALGVWIQVAFVVLLLLLAIALVGWWSAHTRTRRRNRARQRRATRGEELAESLVEALGMTVVERQAGRAWTLEVDGVEREVLSRADLLAEDAEGGRWVVEVKTGERAPDPALPATRRQLLEYLLAFEVEGVLLVDAETEEVHEVRFPWTG